MPEYEIERSISKPVEVCIVGVGFVGLTLAMALTKKGIKVRGLEKNSKFVEDLNNGVTEVLEPGLDESLTEAIRDGLFNVYQAEEDIADILSCNVFILTVGTPIQNRTVDMEILRNAVKGILPYLKTNDLVIVRSTVMVGATRSLVLALLEETGLDINLAMCPERTIEGDALREIEFLPQIIGALNEESARAAHKLFSKICREVILVDSLEAAELTKLVNNTYRDVMFGFSNEIAMLANSLGISANQIIEAANRNYTRSNIARPGPSGGPCLEKDPWILIQSAKLSGVELAISQSARLMNESIISEFLRKSLTNVGVIRNVGILGLAFKGNPPTKDTRGSAAYEVVDFFTREIHGVRFLGYEPAGLVRGFEDVISQQESAESVISECDYLVVLTNSGMLARVNELISTLGKPNLVIVDFWDVVSKESIGNHQTLFSWGGSI
jgi:nucleotide sugar dehydrogenase